MKMPELPEIINLSEQMNQELQHTIIKDIYVMQEKCINMPAADFIKLLSNKRVEQVSSRGKWIITRLDHGVGLFLNLGMGGNVILHENDHDLPSKYQLRIDMHDKRVLTISFWWFGYIHCVDKGDWGSHKGIAKLGPTPIRDPEFTQVHFINLLQGRKGSVKNYLLNQNNIAGIGNVYVQDILFRAKIHPDRKLQTLSEAEKFLLYRSIIETLEGAVKLGGLAYEKDLYNQPGRFKDFLVGYREDLPCPICKTLIQKIKSGSTASYICPACQGLDTNGANV
ncbi:Fpg/Nei family DNA glycosylase [Pelosinus baikalensis]|uniref:Formamidopyrimidine-DNA glycosylase n=1 Tax=Pelosinus baikalensis TaxID=2892015 RepID=A0ABS8HVH2_9FIRM|nr:DNA-formamidopyrimidine glycosylase family protein [Pelosinus baikalensis]MCC5466514.1 hypothetical protein [Pelosinus baikalensis]